jgi:hypothetical protein
MRKKLNMAFKEFCSKVEKVRNNVHTYIHTYIHTYQHTYIHTYINIRELLIRNQVAAHYDFQLHIDVPFRKLGFKGTWYCKCTRIHTYSTIQCIHTYIHTYIHIFCTSKIEIQKMAHSIELHKWILHEWGNKFTHFYLYLCTYVCMHAYNVCMYVCILCMYVCMYVCMYAYYVCMYVCP